MTIREAAHILAAVSDTSRLDAELLLAHALGISREALLLGNHAAPPEFTALVERRLAHEPVAYITGTRAFWTIELEVTPAVLIPRPDSETLIDAAVAHFGRAGPKRVLDLGTGSGALLLATLAQWPEATGLGVDTSAEAIGVARLNARQLGMVNRAKFTCGGWTSASAQYDLVLCNPPYIGRHEALPPSVARYEPHSALFAGDDGLDDYRMIAPVLDFSPGGIACIEIGSTQAQAVTQLLTNEGFSVALRRDLGARDRCLVASRN